MSHSHGPGWVSSKSLRSKISIALRGGEGAEVEKMSVAANLQLDTCRWRAAQIGGHDRWRAPVESKRRGHHSTGSDWDKLRYTVRVPPVQDRKRIGTVGGGAQRP